MDIHDVIQQYHQILKALADKDSASLPTLIEGVSVMSKILSVKGQDPAELKTLLAQNGTIRVLLDLIRDCKLDREGRQRLLPIVIDTISLLLCDCQLANEKMMKSRGKCGS